MTKEEEKLETSLEVTIGDLNYDELHYDDFESKTLKGKNNFVKTPLAKAPDGSKHPGNIGKVEEK